MGTRRTPLNPPVDGLALNGRLTEHTAHLDVLDPEATISYPSGGRTVTFHPDKLVILFQWAWSAGGPWHVLEVKALGRSGTRNVTYKFTKPENAPDWVQRAITLAMPPLELAG